MIRGCFEGRSLCCKAACMDSPCRSAFANILVQQTQCGSPAGTLSGMVPLVEGRQPQSHVAPLGGVHSPAWMSLHAFVYSIVCSLQCLLANSQCCSHGRTHSAAHRKWSTCIAATSNNLKGTPLEETDLRFMLVNCFHYGGGAASATLWYRQSNCSAGHRFEPIHGQPWVVV